MYKIVLSDGTVLENIGSNGSMFISYTLIDKSTFEHNLSPVDVEYTGDPNVYRPFQLEGHYENAEYIAISGAPEGQWYFALIEIPESEMKYAKIRSQIEYISMMTGIEL